jgi:hypothetical protein
MGFRERARHELRAVGTTTAFFFAWFCVLGLLKRLTLADYDVEFRVLTVAIIGALVVAKVVLLAEHVPLGGWVERRPAWVHVVVRTALYGLGVLVVMLLEKAFESRHEHGGFLQALAVVFRHRDIPHVWASTIGVTGALLVFNGVAVVRRHLGAGGLRRIFSSPVRE